MWQNTSTSFTGSIKYDQSLHGNAKPLRLEANRPAHLAKQKLSTKKQQNISVRSTTSNIVTTLDDDKGVSSSVADEEMEYYYKTLMIK